MNATSMRRRAVLLRDLSQADWGAVAVWVLCFGLVVYLGTKGGGYDPLVHDQIGIAVWWIALAGIAIGALPRRRPSRMAWGALALLVAFVAWTALSLTWTESTARTSADLARLSAYMGIFALAVFTRVSRESQRLIGAVAAGIAVVGVVALLSRLHPAWFPAAGQTATFISDSRERLSYPIDYWNGLGAMLAIGIPLLLQVATDARSRLLRALAAAAMPVMALTLFFTLSRGSMAAAAIAIAIFLALAPDRLPRMLALLVAGAGSAVLIAAATQRDALQHGLDNATAHQQGNDLLAIAIVVCVVVGAVQAAISHGLLGERRPRWTRVSRNQSIVALGVGVLILLAVAVAVDAPGRASSGWSEFREGGNPGSGTGRLGSVAGQSRYQLWLAALHENGSKPFTGTGSGTFELWWARHNTTGESVRDTHSLYLQTLGELGIVGAAVLVAFLLAVFAGGGFSLARARPAARAPLAAALAGCAAFCLAAVVDWMWQIPVLAAAFLLLASLLVTGDRASEDASRPSLGAPLRAGLVALAFLGIVVIAIPLASTTLLRDSEADARSGRLDSALDAARKAQNVQSGSAAPRLQEALVLEERGELSAAAAASSRAVDLEPLSWRNLLVFSRIEAERGRAVAAVDAYARAKALHSGLPFLSG